MANGTYPLNIRGELDSPSRWLWIFKWLLAIPHYICLWALGIAFVVVWIITFFAILFTGKHPRGLFDFKLGVLRWYWRVAFYSYEALGTDKYPPFSLDPDPNYPADLDMEYTEKMSRGLVLIKWWLLAIPHWIFIWVFASGMNLSSRVSDGVQAGGNFPGIISIMAVIAAIILLFSGKYPQGFFKAIIGLNRWVFRAVAYISLMTDDYPPFSMD